jgi:hypothetical protein
MVDIKVFDRVARVLGAIFYATPTPLVAAAIVAAALAYSAGLSRVGWFQRAAQWLMSGGADMPPWVSGHDLTFASAYVGTITAGCLLTLLLMAIAGRFSPLWAVLAAFCSIAGVVGSVTMEWMVSASDTPAFAASETKANASVGRRLYLHGVMGACTAALIMAIPAARPFALKI